MNFLEKLNFLMEKKKLNKNTLSKACNIPYTTIDNWYKRGYAGVKLTTLRKLAKYFNTSIDYWVLDEVNDFNYGKNNMVQLNPKDIDFIEKYQKLDNYGKEIIDYIINKEYERAQEEDSTNIIYRPIYELHVSAGTGQFLDSDNYEIKAFPADQVPDDSTFGVVITGDSMEPKYHDQQTVFAKQDPDLQPGEIGIFVLNDEGYIKQLVKTNNGYSLHSLNRKYEDIPIREFDELRVVGKVVGKL